MCYIGGQFCYCQAHWVFAWRYWEVSSMLANIKMLKTKKKKINASCNCLCVVMTLIQAGVYLSYAIVEIINNLMDHRCTFCTNAWESIRFISGILIGVDIIVMTIGLIKIYTSFRSYKVLLK